MTSLADIRARSNWRDIFEGQLQHLGFTILLAAGAGALLVQDSESARLFGLSSRYWALLSMGLAILHQWLVAAVFRLELHRNLVSRVFRGRDLQVWTAVFLPLLIARPITLLFTGWAESPPIGGPWWARLIVGIVFIGISIWTLHSVLIHFTIRRAVGGDHFRDEIAQMPLVTQGAFRWTNNAMYGLAFLGLWGIALLCNSWNALVLALFQHCYIWVHMYCTEKPDMDWIYGDR